MRMYTADLHIHTCLSPCADLEMSPQNIVRRAQTCGIDIIGICDHNSCENVPAVKKNADRAGITAVGGIEVTSREEVHIVALFDNEQDLFSMQDIVYGSLKGTHDDRMYGEQVVANENDEVVDFNKKLLIGATDLSLEKVVGTIHELHGLAIASHIERDSFGIIGHLGFIPPGLDLDALEVSSRDGMACIEQTALPLIHSSDAHYLDDIGRRFIRLVMEEVTCTEMKMALHGRNGRRVTV